MISCVERASLHFCSDAAAARVANARMQPSGASHRLCEAYCQRLAGRSFPDAHVAFHDVFFPRRAQRQVWALRSSCRREPPPRAKLGRPAQVVVPGGGLFALATGEVRGRIFSLHYARPHARRCLGWLRAVPADDFHG